MSCASGALLSVLTATTASLYAPYAIPKVFANQPLSFQSPLWKWVWLILFVGSATNFVLVAKDRKRYTLRAVSPSDPPPPSCDAKLVEVNGEKAWVLDVWEPSICWLLFTSFFTPLHCVQLWVYGVSRSLVLLLAWSMLLAGTIAKFRRTIDNQRVIAAQVLDEYTTKYVRPVSSRAMRDVAVDSTETRAYASTPRREFTPRDARSERQRSRLSMSVTPLRQPILRPVRAPSPGGSPRRPLSKLNRS